MADYDVTFNPNVPVSETFSAMDRAVDMWFETVITKPSIHWANIVLGGFLFGTSAKTNIHRYEGIGTARRIVMAVLTIGGSEILNNLMTGGSKGSDAMRATASAVNAVMDELKDPNIEGIPIHAVKETESRDIEVNSQIVVAMAESEGGVTSLGAASKDVVVDNAVPRLKQWQINGYLTSLPDGLDPYLIIKPGLKLQKMLLDIYATSRRPVWYKTHDGSFHKVLISHIDTAYDTQGLNGVAINVTLTEFKVLTMGSSTLAAIKAKLKV